MPRLLVNPGTPQTWEIQLKPGINFLGRGPSNDFKFDDASVSGAHCQIMVDGGGVLIRDMGSTNGTFVNRAKIHESVLATGQPVRLGSVDMIFYSDVTPPAVTSQTTAPPPPAPPISAAPPPAPVLNISAVPISIPQAPPVPITTTASVSPAPAAASASLLKISGLGHASAVTSAPVLESDAPPLAPPVPGAPAIAIDVGARYCKFHPRSPARFLCKKCDRTYCELCVTTLNVGGKTKISCRGCGLECVPVRVHLETGNAPASFFGAIPGAFAYPLRGTGILFLLLGMLIFAGIMLANVMVGTLNVRGMGMGVIMHVILGGYLFTFLQNIIHSTAAGDREVPELPGINFLEDILLPFFRLLGLILACFTPVICLAIVTVITKSPVAAISIFPAMIFGCLYFPMAFLVVAILDSVGAVNPLVVIPSILKVPLEYLVTVFILMAVVVFTRVGDIIVAIEFRHGMSTDSIPELLGLVGVKFVWSLVSIYLLVVNTRILGVLYLSKKDKLAWIGH
jgi:hypothetical protein